MPELPDVAVAERYLRSTALHRPIERVSLNPEISGSLTPSGLGRRVHGKRLEETHRHGKVLYARVAEKGWLRLHFGMTGSLIFMENGPLPDHTHLAVEFQDGSRLGFRAPRKIARVGWVETPEEDIAERELGPDALGLDLRGFREILDGRRGALKPTVMNQKVIAGLGNVYTDEVLFHARIHPKISCDDLATDTVARLHRSMKTVLERAIAAGAEPSEMPGRYLLPHRDPDEECPRCGASWSVETVGGRTTYYCPKEQPSP